MGVVQTLGSLLIPLLIGVGLGDLLNGLPIDSHHDFTGNFFDLLTPYGLWTGVTLLGLCLLHGATFLKLRTTGECASARAPRRGRWAGWRSRWWWVSWPGRPLLPTTPRFPGPCRCWR